MSQSVYKRRIYTKIYVEGLSDISTFPAAQCGGHFSENVSIDPANFWTKLTPNLLKVVSHVQVMWHVPVKLQIPSTLYHIKAY